MYTNLDTMLIQNRIIDAARGDNNRNTRDEKTSDIYKCFFLPVSMKFSQIHPNKNSLFGNIKVRCLPLLKLHSISLVRCNRLL